MDNAPKALPRAQRSGTLHDHDLLEATAIGDGIASMSDGKIEQVDLISEVFEGRARSSSQSPWDSTSSTEGSFQLTLQARWSRASFQEPRAEATFQRALRTWWSR